MKRIGVVFFFIGAVLILGSLFAQTSSPDLSFLSPAAREAFEAAKFGPLGTPISPKGNPATPAKVALGRALYFDQRLSADGSVSCATCHHPDKTWADDEQTATGIRGQHGPRNSPTVLDAAFYTRFFWDGRAASLEEQALGPVQNPVEMGNTVRGMTLRLSRIGGYAPMFRAAFGTEEVTPNRVAQAIAAFERTVVSGPSAFDRFLAGDSKALSAAQKRGLALFLVKGECTTCHGGPFLTTEAKLAGIRVPTLRNVAMTAPYFNDGSARTLDEAIAQRGPKTLTAAERKDLQALLEAFSGQLPAITAEVTLPK